MNKNIVAVTVVFNSHINSRHLTNPTFKGLFDRIDDVKRQTPVPNKEYTFHTNRTHKGQLERMGHTFICVSSIKFTNVK